MTNMRKSEGICEMCGNYVAMREKAHIVSEVKSFKNNMLMLCINCHRMFDVELKPILYKALSDVGVKKLPNSWKKSIHEQALDTWREKRKKETKSSKKDK